MLAGRAGCAPRGGGRARHLTRRPALPIASGHSLVMAGRAASRPARQDRHRVGVDGCRERVLVQHGLDPAEPPIKLSRKNTSTCTTSSCDTSMRRARRMPSGSILGIAPSGSWSSTTSNATGPSVAGGPPSLSWRAGCHRPATRRRCRPAAGVASRARVSVKLAEVGVTRGRGHAHGVARHVGSRRARRREGGRGGTRARCPSRGRRSFRN